MTAKHLIAKLIWSISSDNSGDQKSVGDILTGRLETFFPHDMEKATLITWCGQSQLMPIWLLGRFHSGETEEASCSWLHKIWPSPRRPGRASTIYVVSGTSTKLILCIDRVFDVWNKVYKPHRIVWGRCRYINGWKWPVMKPTVHEDEANCRATFGQDEGNWVRMKLIPHLWRALKHNDWLLIVIQHQVMHQY